MMDIIGIKIFLACIVDERNKIKRGDYHRAKPLGHCWEGEIRATQEFKAGAEDEES